MHICSQKQDCTRQFDLIILLSYRLCQEKHAPGAQVIKSGEIYITFIFYAVGLDPSRPSFNIEILSTIISDEDASLPTPV